LAAVEDVLTLRRDSAVTVEEDEVIPALK